MGLVKHPIQLECPSDGPYAAHRITAVCTGAIANGLRDPMSNRASSADMSVKRRGKGGTILESYYRDGVGWCVYATPRQARRTVRFYTSLYNGRTDLLPYTRAA